MPAASASASVARYEARLNRRASDAQAEANAINKAAGFYMCMGG